MNNRIKRSTVNVLLLMFIMFFTLIGYPQDKNEHRANYANTSDAVITHDVLKGFTKNLFYGIFDWVTVDSKDGVVTMEGWVHLPWLKSQLQNAAQKVPGVKSINNKIEYTFGPGRIGVKAAHLIYSDPWYIGQAYTVNPPVHIIVNNNIVILEGVVSDEVLRDQAEYLVSTFTDAFSVQNNLKIMKKASTKKSS